VPNLNFPAPTIPEIWKGSQNLKSRERDPFSNPLTYFFTYFRNLLPLVVNPHAKFEVSSLVAVPEIPCRRRIFHIDMVSRA